MLSAAKVWAFGVVVLTAGCSRTDIDKCIPARMQDVTPGGCTLRRVGLPVSVFASVRDDLFSPTILTINQANTVHPTTLLIHARSRFGNRLLRVAVGDDWPCDVELEDDRVVDLHMNPKLMVPSHRGPPWVTLVTHGRGFGAPPSMRALDAHSWTFGNSSVLSLPTTFNAATQVGFIEEAVLHNSNGSTGTYALAYRDGGGFEVNDWPVVAVVDAQGYVVGGPSPLGCCFPYHTSPYLPTPAIAAVDDGTLLASAHRQCPNTAPWCVEQSVVVLHVSLATEAAPQIRSVIPKVLPQPWFGSFDIAADDDHAWLVWSERAYTSGLLHSPDEQTIFAVRLTLKGEPTMTPVVVATGREVMGRITLTTTQLGTILTWVEAISGEPNDARRAARIVVQRLDHVSQLEPAVVLDAGLMRNDSWWSGASVTSVSRSRSLFIAWTPDVPWDVEWPIQLARLDCR